jgi:proteasome lid subunit RPN8/RPN11
VSDNNNDFEIELGKSFSRRFEDKPSPLRDRSQCAFPYDRPESDDIPVFIAERVLRAVEAQAKENAEIEVGGVLLGAFYRGDKGSFIEVTDSIEAGAARSTGVSLTFTHETWELIHAEQAKRRPGLMIVGWYHTHPGLGVFLSNEDEFIHTSYFTDPWQVALVVDPVYDNWGCFKWTDGSLGQCGGFYVFGDRGEAKQVKQYISRLEGSRQRPSEAVSAAADRRGSGSGAGKAVWAAVVVLLVMQSITGWMLLRKTPQPEQADTYAVAQRLLASGDLTGGEQALRTTLLADPTNDRALLDLQRLEAIAGSPGVRAPQQDRANFLLASADEMARSKPRLARKGTLEGLSSDQEIKLEAADPVARAFSAYESARRSRDARIVRALSVQEYARLVLGQKTVKDAWWNKAVKWLQQEQLREIAYGLHSGQSGYDRIFAKLAPSDQAAVKKIRAEIARAR